MTNTFSRLTALMAFSPAVLFFTSFQISAAVGDTFVIDDLKYTVLTEEGSTGTVSIYKNGSISGDLIISSSVKNNDITYSVTSIRDSAFKNCSSLTSITISDSVTSIGSEAFYKCSSLTSITIPDSVAFIGIEAFRYCSSLTSITIPDSVTLIESWAFADCSSLTSVYFEGNAPNIEYKGLFDNTPATIYYRAGTEGWTDPWCGRPTKLWGETPEDKPVIRFELEGDGESLVLNFAGTLYESDDAVNWHPVEGAKAPFKVYTSKGKKFYRCAQ